jgi:hypothetical protein
MSKRKLTAEEKRDLADLVTSGMAENEALAVLRVRRYHVAATARQASHNKRPWQDLSREITCDWSSEQKDAHDAFIRRGEAFSALTRAEQTDMARFVLAHDPELANEVKEGYTPLFEAYHELQQAAAFLG